MFFSHKKSDRLSLIIDVQSSVVRSALALYHGNQSTIVFTRDFPIVYKSHARSGYLIKEALLAVEQAVADTIIHVRARHSHDKTFPRHIANVHYVLSSPWIISNAKTISTTFDRRRTVNKDYIEKLIAEDRRKLIAEAGDKDIRIIEEKIFDVRLNGYSVAQWQDHPAEKLDISFVASVAGGRMIDRFIDAVRHAVRHRHVYFHSSLFLQHIGLGVAMEKERTYALIHIHGELTDVALIQDGVCRFSGSYPFGVNGVIRTIAREAHVDAYTAESILNMSISGNMDPDHADREAQIVERIGATWTEDLSALVKGPASSGSLPRTIITSARSHEDFFMRLLSRAYPESALKPLSLDELTPYVCFDAHAERLRTTGLYAIAIHTMESQSAA